MAENKELDKEPDKEKLRESSLQTIAGLEKNIMDFQAGVKSLFHEYKIGDSATFHTEIPAHIEWMRKYVDNARDDVNKLYPPKTSTNVENPDSKV